MISRYKTSEAICQNEKFCPGIMDVSRDFCGFVGGLHVDD